MATNNHPGEDFGAPRFGRTALTSLLLVAAGLLVARGQVTNVDSKPPKALPTPATAPVKKPAPTNVNSGVGATPSPAPVRADKAAPPLWLVSFAEGDPCGSEASVYTFNEAGGAFERRLVLRCVRDLRQEGDDANGHPRFVYTTSGPSQGQLYKAILRFEGASYQQESCQTAKDADPKNFVAADCDDRVLVHPPRPGP